MGDIEYWDEALKDDVTTIKSLLSTIPNIRDPHERNVLIDQAKNKLRSAQQTKRSFKLEYRLLVDPIQKERYQIQLFAWKHTLDGLSDTWSSLAQSNPQKEKEGIKGKNYDNNTIAWDTFMRNVQDQFARAEMECDDVRQEVETGKNKNEKILDDMRDDRDDIAMEIDMNGKASNMSGKSKIHLKRPRLTAFGTFSPVKNFSKKGWSSSFKKFEQKIAFPQKLKHSRIFRKRVAPFSQE